MKYFSFIKDENRDIYCKKIDDFCKALRGNYLKLDTYFFKYWRNAEIFNFSNLDNNKIKILTSNNVERFHKKLNYDIAFF